jgi:membrane protein required for colicin V production
VVRGFVLVVIPYMFYESFVPDPNQQFPWVRDASSLPYIKSTGNTFRTVLVRIVPGSIAGPEQQGAVDEKLWLAALGDGQSHKIVIYTRRTTG